MRALRTNFGDLYTGIKRVTSAGGSNMARRLASWHVAAWQVATWQVAGGRSVSGSITVNRIVPHWRG